MRGPAAIPRRAALYKEFKLDEPWDSAHNIKLLAKMPAVFAAPGITTKEPFTTFYQVFTGREAAFDLQSKSKFRGSPMAPATRSASSRLTKRFPGRSRPILFMMARNRFPNSEAFFPTVFTRYF